MALVNLGTINNNTVRTRLNQTVTTAQPRDVFKFTTTNARSINLLLTDLNGDADLALYRDENGNGTLQTFGSSSDRLISTSANGSSYDGFLDDHINRWGRPGTYFVVVEQYDSTSPISYDLYVAASRVAGRTGPPNTLARENDLGTLSSDVSFSDSVGFRRTSGFNGYRFNERGDTSDLYYFTVASGDTVNIELTGLNADADIRLLQDFDNDRRADPGEDIDQSTNFGTNSESISVNTPGTYYLQVYPFAKTPIDINYDITFDVV